MRFVAADKGHNVLSIEGMSPDGAAPFSGKMNEDITVTFDEAGTFNLTCKIHPSMNMTVTVEG